MPRVVRIVGWTFPAPSGWPSLPLQLLALVALASAAYGRAGERPVARAVFAA